MSYLSPIKKANHTEKSFLGSAANTPLKTSDRTVDLTKVHEIPLNPQAQYVISLVPGAVEHEIETGKTLQEAQMKVVLLTCELERVNTHNYTLVRENEVLRVQANKSEREKDLETKLAIVLAENEKLNQIIEDVYETYMSQQRNEGNNEEYEQRLGEMLLDLQEWKDKYDTLEKQGNIVELQNKIKELQTQKELVEEELERKDRDLEALRARLNSLQTESSQVNELQLKINTLNAYNETLKKDVEALRAKCDKVDALQAKLNENTGKIESILVENGRLNDMLLEKISEVNDLRTKIGNGSGAADKLKDANAENNYLRQQVVVFTQENEKLKADLAAVRAWLARCPLH